MKNAVVLVIGICSGAIVVGAFAAWGAVIMLRMLRVLP